MGLKLHLDKTSSRLPTDTSAFVARDVPILSAFTGVHQEYNTPRDTPDTLDYEALGARRGRGRILLDGVERVGWTELTPTLAFGVFEG